MMAGHYGKSAAGRGGLLPRSPGKAARDEAANRRPVVTGWRPGGARTGPGAAACVRACDGPWAGRRWSACATVPESPRLAAGPQAVGQPPAWGRRYRALCSGLARARASVAARIAPAALLPGSRAVPASVPAYAIPAGSFARPRSTASRSESRRPRRPRGRRPPRRPFVEASAAGARATALAVHALEQVHHDRRARRVGGQTVLDAAIAAAGGRAPYEVRARRRTGASVELRAAAATHALVARVAVLELAASRWDVPARSSIATTVAASPGACQHPAERQGEKTGHRYHLSGNPSSH